MRYGKRLYLLGITFLRFHILMPLNSVLEKGSCGFSKARSRAGVQSVLSIMELGPAEHQAS